MKGLVLIISILLLQGCDAPWAGPTLPAGGQWVSFTTVSSEGPPVVIRDGIIAATSTAEAEAAVVTSGATFHQTCPSPCWRIVQADEPGHVYLAVAILPDGCDHDVKEGAAIAGRMLYFIHWVSAPNGSRCDAAQAARWRLLSVSRRDLPNSGTLTVRLQMQGYYGTSAIETEVELT
jgi:hypothetical protein